MTGSRVLLLVPARSYRAADFLAAVGRLGLDLVIGSDGALPLGGRPVVHVTSGDPDASAGRIMASTGPVAAVVAAATPGITGLTITVRAGQHVRPLPDPGPYLGFIFAACDTHNQVEQALAAARERLRVMIDRSAPCETSGHD